MLETYLVTLFFIYLMSISYGVYKLVNSLADGRSFFMPDKEKMENKPFIEEQMPDEGVEMPDELYSAPEELINPELLKKNRLHDEKIERLKAELSGVQQVGVVFNEDHIEVDKGYIPKPTHEYTD